MHLSQRKVLCLFFSLWNFVSKGAKLSTAIANLSQVITVLNTVILKGLCFIPLGFIENTNNLVIQSHCSLRRIICWGYFPVSWLNFLIRQLLCSRLHTLCRDMILEIDRFFSEAWTKTNARDAARCTIYFSELLAMVFILFFV